MRNQMNIEIIHSNKTVAEKIKKLLRPYVETVLLDVTNFKSNLVLRLSSGRGLRIISEDFLEDKELKENLLQNLKTDGRAGISIIVLCKDTKRYIKSDLFQCEHIDFISESFDEMSFVSHIKNQMALVKDFDDSVQREQNLREIIEILRALNKEWERLSSLDPLTNLSNRRYFNERFDNEWKRAQRSKSSIGLLLIDIDHFKAFNDCYGHLRGDECLQQVSQALRDAVRRPADMVARYGGEEFIILLPNTEMSGACVVAEVVRKRILDLNIEAPFPSFQGAPLTVSVGVAAGFPQPSLSTSELLDHADQALYSAKEAGRNQVACYTDLPPFAEVATIPSSAGLTDLHINK